MQFTLLILIVGIILTAAQTSGGFPPITNLSSLHPNAYTEWTYTSSNLKSVDPIFSREYGIFAVSFYIPPSNSVPAPKPGFNPNTCSQVVAFPTMSIVTDTSYRTHTYVSNDLYCSQPWSSLSADSVVKSSLKWLPAFNLKYGDLGAHYEWTGNLGNDSFYLQGIDVTGVQLHYGTGVTAYADSHTDFYYSLHIEVSGWVIIDGIFDIVKGYIWLDHEWDVVILPDESVSVTGLEAPTTYAASVTTANQQLAIESGSGTGWTWSGGQYHNLTDHKTYFMDWERLRAPGGYPFFAVKDGFEIMPAGGVSQMYSHPTSINVKQVWTSAQSNVTYPIEFDVTFEGWGTLSYHPIKINQEFASLDTTVWEGLSHVTCSRADVTNFIAYLEFAFYISS